MERRSFFKLAGLSAAVLAVGGTLGACEAGKLPDNPLAATNKANETAGQSSVMGQPPIAFDADVDVLIVGSGVAGLSAAMDPLEAKRSVMVVEKLDLLGGESYESNGVMRIAGTTAQQDAGVNATVDEAWGARKKELSAAGDDDLGGHRKGESPGIRLRGAVRRSENLRGRQGECGYHAAEERPR